MTNSTTRSATGVVLVAVLAVGCFGGKRTTTVRTAPTIPVTPPPAPVFSDGESLIRAMHARYARTWYRTMTFVQKTTLYSASGVPSVQTWYEALSLPGRLRIDFDNPDTRSGALYRGDSTFSFASGRLTRSAKGSNDLLILGFDVYTQPPETTIAVLRGLGYDLSRLRTQEFEGKPTYVVGSASATDTTSKQFWVERDRLLFVRSMERQASGRHTDIRFTDYVPAGNGLVAKTVVQFVDGKRRLLEEYQNIRTDPPLDPALFDPRQWATVKHWTKP
jgi:hypothetical protein